MEHQTCATITTWHPLWAEVNIAHELSHQWWGDMITCQDFHHIWLNEGFATYSADLYFERVYGRQFFINTLLQYAYYGEGTIYVYDTTNVRVIFSENLSYNKAEWVLHMLRHVVGDSAFFTILRTYYADKRYQYGTATTEDFRDVCEQVSGKDLHQFFQQWIYGEKFPTYSYSWSAAHDTNGGNVVDIHLTQSTGTTNPLFFTMPIDFRLKAGAWDTTVVLFNSSQSQLYRLHASHQPDTVELDPDHWILHDAHVTPFGKPFIVVDSRTVDFGAISDITPRRDTTFLVRNTGLSSDSLMVSVDPFNVTPDSAIAVSPAAFVLAGCDSQRVIFSIRPRLLAPSTYNAAITVQPRSGLSQGSLSKVFIFRKVITDASESTGLPKEFALHQNFPNPFNPSTVISYELPLEAHVTLTVFNTIGQIVGELVNCEMEAGVHEVKFDPSGLSSGAYFYQLRAGDFVQSKKLMLAK
jgi:hypothetical protein